jgi:hypothetical protein
MIIAEKSAPACSPPVDDAEVSLLDQLKWVTFGYDPADVFVALAILMTENVVTNTKSKHDALQLLAGTVMRIAEDIDRDYEAIKASVTTSGKAS